MNKKLLMDAATLKRVVVDVLGEKITVVEPPIGVRMEYLRQVRGGTNGQSADNDRAVALLLYRCCRDDQDNSLFTEEEALAIAKGSQRVAAPLLNAILSGEDEDSVKNVSAPSEGSSSNSQPI